MAVNVPGLISIIVFYILILVVGIIAARKTGFKARNLSRQDVMLAGRNIGLFVGLFTITGGTDAALILMMLYTDTDDVVYCTDDVDVVYCH